MDEFLKLLTPQNFAMVIAVYLLVRFEKAFRSQEDAIGRAMKSLEDGIEKLEKHLTDSINRNSRLLAILLYSRQKEDNRAKNGLNELLNSDSGNKKEAA